MITPKLQSPPPTGPLSAPQAQSDTLNDLRGSPEATCCVFYARLQEPVARTPQKSVPSPLIPYKLGNNHRISFQNKVFSSSDRPSCHRFQPLPGSGRAAWTLQIRNTAKPCSAGAAPGGSPHPSSFADPHAVNYSPWASHTHCRPPATVCCPDLYSAPSLCRRHVLVQALLSRHLGKLILPLRFAGPAHLQPLPLSTSSPTGLGSNPKSEVWPPLGASLPAHC